MSYFQTILQCEPDENDPAPDSTAHLIPSNASHQSELCVACSTIDWAQLARDQLPNIPVSLFPEMRATHDELLRSSCRVCSSIATIKPPSLDGQPCRLVAIRSDIALATDKICPSGRTCTVIGIWPEDRKFTTAQECIQFGYVALVGSSDLHLQGFDVGPRKVLPDAIDFGDLQKLIAFCDQGHPGDCFIKSESRKPNVLGLLVIDCSTKTVVSAPKDCQYLALSYVWGKPQAPSPGERCGEFPPTISDAIQVTIALGFQYLWVDRYCIDQTSEDMKHDMIRQMGEIYANAFLTIIAAAGEDSNHGLPGISAPRVNRQHESQVQDALFIQIFPHGPAALDSTKWASRAWTYQECYLSKRRLVFTDQEVIFLCNTMYASESVKLPFVPRYPYRFGYLDQALLHLIPGLFPAPPSDLDPLTVQITEFSKRSLTYGTDSLNAFLGVLDIYKKGKATQAPSYHIWGAPLFPILGRHRQEYYLALEWRHDSPGVRRPEFPTWAWAGWEGTVYF
ncbi:heterokaryon incompatibility protein-domain-containing protein, partial [Podospora didyma]